jgi:hypothetical protein
VCGRPLPESAGPCSFYRRPLVCNEFVRIGSAQLLSIKHPASRPLDRSDREPSISEVVNSEQSWQQQRFHRRARHNKGGDMPAIRFARFATAQRRCRDSRY